MPVIHYTVIYAHNNWRKYPVNPAQVHIIERLTRRLTLTDQMMADMTELSGGAITFQEIALPKDPKQVARNARQNQRRREREAAKRGA